MPCLAPQASHLVEPRTARVSCLEVMLVDDNDLHDDGVPGTPFVAAVSRLFPGGRPPRQPVPTNQATRFSVRRNLSPKWELARTATRTTPADSARSRQATRPATVRDPQRPAPTSRRCLVSANQFNLCRRLGANPYQVGAGRQLQPQSARRLFLLPRMRNVRQQPVEPVLARLTATKANPGSASVPLPRHSTIRRWLTGGRRRA